MPSRSRIKDIFTCKTVRIYLAFFSPWIRWTISELSNPPIAYTDSEKVTTDVKNIMLKTDQSINISRSDTMERRPIITQLKIRINEERPTKFRGRMNPRKDGRVLYSIPNIMIMGNSNHNSM